MFILRQFFKSGTVQNMCLGERYILIKKETDPQDFERTMGNKNGYPDHEKVFGFVSYNDGSEAYPLYEGHTYYIMTESGKTFEKIKP